MKRIVDLAHGEGVDSVPGEGATFWFTIPLSGIPRRAAEPSGDAVTAPSRQSFLVFTRDAEMDAQVARYLEPFGNHVQSPETLSDAIALAAREPFDAIVVRANEADSWAAARGVSAPVLALLQRGERAPIAASEVLHWPADAQELYQVLARLRERMEPKDAHRSADVELARSTPSVRDAERSLGEHPGRDPESYIADAVQRLADSCRRKWDDASGWRRTSPARRSGLACRGDRGGARLSRRRRAPARILRTAMRSAGGGGRAAAHQAGCCCIRRWRLTPAHSPSHCSRSGMKRKTSSEPGEGWRYCAVSFAAGRPL